MIVGQAGSKNCVAFSRHGTEDIRFLPYGAVFRRRHRAFDRHTAAKNRLHVVFKGFDDLIAECVITLVYAAVLVKIFAQEFGQIERHVIEVDEKAKDKRKFFGRVGGKEQPTLFGGTAGVIHVLFLRGRIVEIAGELAEKGVKKIRRRNRFQKLADLCIREDEFGLHHLVAAPQKQIDLFPSRIHQ